jgi:hypothetical protein
MQVPSLGNRYLQVFAGEKEKKKKMCWYGARRGCLIAAPAPNP